MRCENVIHNIKKLKQAVSNFALMSAAGIKLISITLPFVLSFYKYIECFYLIISTDIGVMIVLVFAHLYGNVL